MQPQEETLVHRQIQLDPKRHRFHNKAACILTLLSCVLLITLSVVFGDHSEFPSSGRVLEDAGNDDDDNGDNKDFSHYSCRYIYDEAPNPGYAQCRFARSCNGGEGLFASWVFCWYNTASTLTLFLIISPFLVVWMVTLFRLLGSTAEDYFSPSLEMFSVKLGLPPRFAGVSLLALGNGAADVSATMSAIVNDEENGYKLSLGALSGAAMLVGGVVAGVVVIVAGGVPCRGALVRDVLALFITILVVWSNLSSGEIGPGAISLFLSMYGLFVCLVLVADVYHRAVVLPRLAAQVDDTEIQRQLQAEQDVHEQVGTAVEQDANGPAVNSALSRVMTAISNYDNPTNESSTAQDGTVEGWGVSSGQLQQRQQDGPIMLHGQHGILHGDGQGPVQTPETGGAYALVEDHIDQICAGGGTSFSASNWSGAWHDGQQEVKSHLNQVYEDVFFNGDLNVGEKFLLACEFPFTVARKITVPIPCEGYYNRGLIALAIVVSPLWFAYYIYSGHEINLLSKHSIFYFLIVWGLTLFAAASVLRYAPGGDGQMAIGVATPIALYGFIIAATWIDFVADHLVALLDFMGIVLRIPGAIMGLTILAWGNSMGDLSANMTMARKGLANMAMTACFAGPVFNILIGLGLGFSSLSAQTGKAESAVSLSAPVVTGFVFVILNCISILATGMAGGKSRIETYYGYIALALYTIYLITSISLEFSNRGDG